MGLPAATGKPVGRLAEGEGAAALTAAGDGLAGCAAAAAEAGAAEALGTAETVEAAASAGAVAGADVGSAVGPLAGVAVDAGALWQAASKPLALIMTRPLASPSRRRRVSCMHIPRAPA